MRRLLLSTAAALGVVMGLGGVASAQTTVATPPPPAGVPGPTYGTWKSTPGEATITAVPGETAPNSFVVHLNARLNFYAGIEGSSANEHGTALGTYKLDPQSFLGYMRVYPGFNAVAANGLKYGVVGEIRMPGSTFAGAGVSPGSTSGTETLYWRRAYGYVGTDEAGTLRFGMGDGPITIFQVGTFEGFNDGAWNGDVPAFIPGVAQPVFGFTDVGGLYTSNKVVYLSPDFSGFQFGIGYEPNTTNLWDSNCGVAGQTCNALSASPVPGSSARRRNTVDVGGSYTGTFGGVGINIGGGYIASETVSAPGAPLGTQYNGLSVGKIGATITFAGFTVGGNLNYGNMNGDYALQPRGGVNTISGMVGAQYEAGPIIVGASYFKTTYANNWTPARGAAGVARTGNDIGVAAGATYQLVPGMAIYLSYLYGQRHQIGWDFNSSAVSPDQNNTHGSVFAIGTQMSW